MDDIGKLRSIVFDNLRAKGGNNFTGKTLARLLPLLVHYVNKDFPLNAERKLRDMLVDIVADGAFTGGVRYFANFMEKPALIVGRKGKGAKSIIDKKIHTPQSIPSALPTNELEQLLSIAGTVFVLRRGTPDCSIINKIIYYLL